MCVHDAGGSWRRVSDAGGSLGEPSSKPGTLCSEGHCTDELLRTRKLFRASVPGDDHFRGVGGLLAFSPRFGVGDDHVVRSVPPALSSSRPQTQAAAGTSSSQCACRGRLMVHGATSSEHISHVTTAESRPS